MVPSSKVVVPAPTSTWCSVEVAAGSRTTSSPAAMRTNEASNAGEVAGPSVIPSAAELSNGTTPVRTDAWSAAAKRSRGTAGMCPEPTGLAAREYSK